MTRQILPRNNFFDGQEIKEYNMDLEQTAWHDTMAAVTDLMVGSGVEKEFATQRVLFDSSDVPATVKDLIDTINFDGEPIFEEDVFGNKIFDQPSDSVYGNFLEVVVSDSDLSGSKKLKVYLFGKEFGDILAQEVLVFNKNESQITRKCFKKITAIMTQDMFGNQNIIYGTACRVAGGKLKIMESVPLSVARDTIMAQQTLEPNIDYINFKPANMAESLDTILEEIADKEGLTADSFGISTSVYSTRELPQNTIGLIIGQKFKATTNNIQKISILLSSKSNGNIGDPGEFDWSGELVLGIRKLQTTTNCPTDTVPGSTIDFDPEPAPIVEVSYDKNDLEELGIILNSDFQKVDFVFTQSLLANPAVAPDITIDDYYMITIRRSGDLSTGTLVLPESKNTNSDNERLSIFSQNKWIDVLESNTWYIVHTSSLRVTDGVAVDNGVQIILPKTKINDSTGTEEIFNKNAISLINTSNNFNNYIVIQKSNNFTKPIPHPSTGNLVYSELEDEMDVSVLSESSVQSLLSTGNKTVILGKALDSNPVGNPIITGTIKLPGLVTENTFTIIQPNSDIILNNLIGSILTPNLSYPTVKYRIIAVDIFEDGYGDVDGDGDITTNDVALAQSLDGYAIDLNGGTIDPEVQLYAITSGSTSIDQLIRADVNGDGVITIADAQAIQQYVSFKTAFDAGSSFKRAVLTVENIIDPLNTNPNIIGDLPYFNFVPFTSINFKIDPVNIWEPENLEITDLKRFVSKTFTEIDIESPQSGGKNMVFIPGDVLLGGHLLAIDGTNYSIDFEIATIVLDLPEGSTQGEIDIFDNFIKNKMKFSDGTFVESGALERNQIKVSTAIKSFAKDISVTPGFEFETDMVDETICALYSQDSGLLRIRANHVKNIQTRPELRTKIILTVYLKKAGFKNTETSVTASQLNNLITVI